jgi:hypothetical protein
MKTRKTQTTAKNAECVLAISGNSLTLTAVNRLTHCGVLQTTNSSHLIFKCVK